MIIRRIVCGWLVLAALASPLTAGVTVNGKVVNGSNGDPVAAATITLPDTDMGVIADHDGRFSLKVDHTQEFRLRVSAIGFETLDTTLVIAAGESPERVTLALRPMMVDGGTMVVTGTRTPQLYKDVPVKTEVVNRLAIESAGAVNLAEALKLETGLRVENNCQNCGFTQLRLLGMEGKYTQLLFDGQASFSGLAGVYGLEQIPEALIDRIEVVKGGGSAVYGGAAVAGVVNIIPRRATDNRATIEYGLTAVDGDSDNTLEFTLERLNETGTSGGFLHGSIRRRDAHDVNGDGFSDLVRIRGEGIGGSWQFRPSPGQVLSLNATYTHEYRRGGDRLDNPAHTVDIAEELEHWRYSGEVRWEHRLNRDLDYSLTSAVAYTDRRSFYGGLAGADPESVDFLESSTGYGSTTNPLWTLSGQVNRRLGRTTVTAGVESKVEGIRDETFGESDTRVIDENYTSVGAYAQASVSFGIRNEFELLTGARIETHSLLSDPMVAPRIAFRWHVTPTLTARLSYAAGFNPPQVFDEDLHIENVAGAQRVIVNAESLREERSNSYSFSLQQEIDIRRGMISIGATAFRTDLSDAFAQRDIGVGGGGQLLTERFNAGDATVQGIESEIGFSVGPILGQLGATIQTAEFAEEVEVFEGRFSNRFLRTPDVYGQAMVRWSLFESVSLTGIGRYTGPMEVPRELDQTLRWVESFVEVDLLARYRFTMGRSGMPLEFTFGVRNIANEFQGDLDSGAERDSAYIYGPGSPRAVVFGLSLDL